MNFCKIRYSYFFGDNKELVAEPTFEENGNKERNHTGEESMYAFRRKGGVKLSKGPLVKKERE